MLVTMRKLIANKTLLQVVAWATAIVMVFGLSSEYLITKIQKIFGLESYAISVRGVKLDEKEFAVKQAELSRSYSASKDDIIKAIGTSMLIDSISKDFNVKISEKYYQRYFAQISQQLKGGDIEKYAAMFGMTLKQLEQKVKENVKQSFSTQLIDAGVFVPSFVYHSKMEEDLNLRKYSILTFPFDRYLTDAKKEELSSDEIEKHYKNNKKDYVVPEKRKVNLWTFEEGDYGINISDKEIEKYYNSNKNNFVKKPAEIQLKRILLTPKNSDEIKQKAIQLKSDLSQGTINFDEALEKYSEDKKGLLDWSTFEALSPEISIAAKKLENDGDISDIIETEEGFEIIQRLGRKAASYKPLSEVKGEIQKSLLKNKFSTRFGFDAKRIIKDSKKNSQKLNSYLESKKASKSTDVVTKDNDSYVSKYAFRMKPGQYSQYFENNKGYIVELVDVQKSYIPELKDIEQKVKEDIWAKKASNKLSSSLSEAYKMLNSGITINEIAEKLNLKTTITPFINRHKNNEIEKLTKDGIPVDRFINLYKKGTSKKIQVKNGYIVKVSDAKQIEPVGNEEQELKLNAYSTYKNVTEQGFIASLAQTGKIDINVKQQKRKQL